MNTARSVGSTRSPMQAGATRADPRATIGDGKMDDESQSWTLAAVTGLLGLAVGGTAGVLFPWRAAGHAYLEQASGERGQWFIDEAYLHELARRYRSIPTAEHLRPKNPDGSIDVWIVRGRLKLFPVERQFPGAQGQLYRVEADLDVGQDLDNVMLDLTVVHKVGRFVRLPDPKMTPGRWYLVKGMYFVDEPFTKLAVEKLYAKVRGDAGESITLPAEGVVLDYVSRTKILPYQQGALFKVIGATRAKMLELERRGLLRFGGQFSDWPPLPIPQEEQARTP